LGAVTLLNRSYESRALNSATTNARHQTEVPRLVASDETLATMLLFWAHVHFYQELMVRACEAISCGDILALAKDVSGRYSA